MPIDPALAPAPPMGWNSYDCYGIAVTEDEFRANIDDLSRRFAAFGYRYAVIDGGWYCAPDGRISVDGTGRCVPDRMRFPSSAQGRGFTELAKRTHDLGLKFGLHMMRGIPRVAVDANLPIGATALRALDIVDMASTCAWNQDMYGLDMNKPGAQLYYDSVLQLLASWGVDYVKYDDIASPYCAADIEAINLALARSGRPMVLSLSPGDRKPAAGQVEHAKRHAHLWRISADIWDKWPDVLQQFERCALWMGHAGPGHWPDADMLPLGRIGIRSGPNGPARRCRLTHDEQRTLVTLWCIFASPLMIGSDLPSLDEFAVGLLTNPRVLEVDQRGRNSRELFRDEKGAAWVSEAPDGGRYLAVFNFANEPAAVPVRLSALALGNSLHVEDLWSGNQAVVNEPAMSPRLPAHGAGLYHVTRGA